jgi:hypothetical protein
MASIVVYQSFISTIPLDQVMGVDSMKTLNIATPNRTASESSSFVVHSKACGKTWSDYYAYLQPQTEGSSNKSHNDKVFMWTVSGGDEYRKSAPMLLTKWKSLGMHPVLVLALDAETATTVCSQGYAAVHWDAPASSYSRVADVKFAVAAALAERGYPGFFMELDVFCRQNPLRLYTAQPQADLVLSGHGAVSWAPNIGVWFTSTRVAPFFRGLTKVLSFSKASRTYSDWENKVKFFFDQDILQSCKEISIDDTILQSQLSVVYYEISDTERKRNLMQYCNQTRLNHVLLDHSYIQSHDPPAVYDTTYCIHPLMDKPFVPFPYKLAVAKFLGFSPEPPLSQTDRLLKLTSGDLTYNDCWNRAWGSNPLPLDEPIKERIQYHIASLVELADATGRILVLPRYLRDKIAEGIPVISVLDVASIDTPWRIMLVDEARIIEDEVDIQVVPPDSDFDASLQMVAQRQNSRVVGVQHICNIEETRQHPRVLARMAKLKFCTIKRTQKYRFTPSVGGWANICIGRS